MENLLKSNLNEVTNEEKTEEREEGVDEARGKEEEERQGRDLVGDKTEAPLGVSDADYLLGFGVADCRPCRPTGCAVGWARPYPRPARRGRSR